MSAISPVSAPPFGQHLRRWRRMRGKSQLELALISGYSQRHLSFVESGRAKPSRVTVHVLCEALGVPLADRNELLLSAGFAPVYRERTLESAELAPFRRELEALLERHDPYPALIIDDAWTMVHANAAALRFFGWLRRGQPLAGDNVLRWSFDEAALKPNILDWAVSARHLYWRLQRDVLVDPHNDRLAALLAEIQPLLPVDSLSDVIDGLRTAPPMMTLAFRRLPVNGEQSGNTDEPEQTVRLFSLLATIGTAQDITLSRLHLETFLPADEASRGVLEALASGSPAVM